MRRKAGTLTSREKMVLLALDRPRYGYDLIQETGIAQGSMYQILERLEVAGYLESEWDTAKKGQGPPRRVYRRKGT